MGERAAAARFCLLHIKVRVAGTTADDMMTPWKYVRRDHVDDEYP